jgi:predicted RNA-binding Zn-ribbon protein involved in translation (DUF1610 family)
MYNAELTSPPPVGFNNKPDCGGRVWLNDGLDDMKIKKITSQSRRDFYAIYECEHCGHEKEGYGYDDAYFHKSVIPGMKCDSCGKMADKDYRPLTTKYEEHVVA